MNLQEAAEAMDEEARKNGTSEFDIIAIESEGMGVEVFEGKVKNTEISNSRGIGIRLFKDNKPGIAFTEKISLPSIRQVITDAIAHSKITDEMYLDFPEVSPIKEIDLKLYDSSLDEFDFPKMIDICKKMEEVALTSNSKVVNVPYIGASRSFFQSVIRNSKGVNFSRKKNGYSGYLGVVSAQDNYKKMGIYSDGGLDYKSFDPEFIAKTAVERSVELLGAEPVKSGPYPIIFSNRVSKSIIGMFLSPFYAEQVQKGRSKLKGKLNTKIASEIITISSEPHIPGLPGSSLWDSEGVPTVPISLISNGVLKSFLYHLESAKKDGVKSNGHGSRGYDGKAGTAIWNLIMEKGSSNLNELMNMYPECILIHKLEGGSGCSAISGEISIGAQGFYCKNGKIDRPVDRITLSSNYFDLIQNIKSISNEYSPVYSSFKAPDILVDPVFVAG